MGSPMEEFGENCYIGVTIAPYCSGSNSEISSLNSRRGQTSRLACLGKDIQS